MSASIKYQNSDVETIFFFIAMINDNKAVFIPPQGTEL